MSRRFPGLITAFLFTTFLFCSGVFAADTESSETVTVAVASNFLLPMRVLSDEFEQQTGAEIKLSSGSSGKLYAQIVNGAPYDFFLSADQEKPIALEKDGLAVPDTRYTYALGRLVLWPSEFKELLNYPSPKIPGRREVDDVHLRMLASLGNSKLAIANPRLAPYGRAAVEVLNALDLYDQLEGNLVRGENISQVYQFVDSGSAKLGFIALSQIPDLWVIHRRNESWLVPEKLHSPIRQDTVFLKRGDENKTALAFYEWLKTEEAQRIIQSFNYSLDNSVNESQEVD